MVGEVRSGSEAEAQTKARITGCSQHSIVQLSAVTERLGPEQAGEADGTTQQAELPLGSFTIQEI